MKVKITIVLFFVYSLMISSLSFADTMHHQGKAAAGATKIKAAKAVKQVVCPVTKTKIDPAKAYSKTVYQGKTYYFCCSSCPPAFKKNPGKYAK